jgi:ABC-type polysaccharide/polyol phosphate export permease
VRAAAAPARELRGDERWSPLAYLIAREVRTRYTGDKLGYAWTYVTPLAWIAVIYASYSLTGRTPSIDTDLFSFIVAGMMPYKAFRYTIASMIRARASTRQLRAAAGTEIDDVYLAIALVELFNSFVIYFLLVTINWLFTGAFELANPLMALTGFLLAWAIGASVGYLITALSIRTPAVARLVPTVLRPVFFLSAIFYTMNELPVNIAHFLQWNPLVDVIEIVRTGVFSSYHSRYLDFTTPLVVITVCMVAGRLLSANAVAADRAGNRTAET